MSGPVVRQVARNPAFQPFRSDSPWNTPIGSGATYEAASDAQTANLIATSVTGTTINAWINWDTFSIPVYRAIHSDTLASVTGPLLFGTRALQYRIPSGATPAAGADANMVVIDPTSHYSDETYQMAGSGAAWTAGNMTHRDLYSKGTESPPGGIRAAGYSLMAGLIQAWELRAKKISHALVLALDNKQLKSPYTWPASSEDSNGAGTYAGLNPQGTLAAIPPSIDINTLGLSADGLTIARALQDFGCYVGDRTSATFTFYAEPASDAGRIGNIRIDMNTIRAQLRVVTNNSSTNVGGGGTRRRPAVPELATP